MTVRPRATAILAWTFPALALALVWAALVLKAPSEFDVAPAIGGSAVPTAFAVTGAVIASRRPRNGIGWLFCFFALGIPAEEVIKARLAVPGDPGPAEVWLAWASFWMWAPTLTALITYLPLTFPDGRIAGRSAWAIFLLAAIGAAAVVVGNALDPQLLDDLQQRNPAGIAGHDALLDALTTWGVLPVGVAVIGSAVTVVRRFRRSTGVLRQQLKWFVFAMACAITAAIANGVLYESGNDSAGQIAFASGFVWLPVAVGVAIFRHRLYDIDRIISRTVGWALVTLFVGGTYLGAVSILTTVTASAAGSSPAVIAAATLAAAAVFGPARRRIQGAVDRRFNRARYDAALTVDAYRAQLRDELDIETISGSLQTAVASALQPRSSALWLAAPEVRT